MPKDTIFFMTRGSQGHLVQQIFGQLFKFDRLYRVDLEPSSLGEDLKKITVRDLDVSRTATITLTEQSRVEELFRKQYKLDYFRSMCYLYDQHYGEIRVRKDNNVLVCRGIELSPITHDPVLLCLGPEEEGHIIPHLWQSEYSEYFYR